MEGSGFQPVKIEYSDKTESTTRVADQDGSVFFVGFGSYGTKDTFFQKLEFITVFRAF